MDKVTEILNAVEQGDTRAAEELFPLVYGELRRIAAHKMAGERSDHTLQPTALVHEVYLRLMDKDGEERSWKNRRHFMAVAAEAMRRVLIDRARRRQATKRGGDQVRTVWNESQLGGGAPDEEILAVHEALQKLEEENEDLAGLVKLRYFAGMTMVEIAAARECSISTVERGWRVARAWLLREISGEEL
ncbi:sigma-70 family RNA polymerase sigma factor [Verrucomicrobiaceae bacterium 227]